MKTLKFIAVALFISMSAFANDSVNSQVEKNFKETFKNAANVSWLEKEDTYLVSFDNNGIQAKAVYTKDGNLVKLLQYYYEDGLPIHIRETISKKLPGKSVYMVTELSTPETTTYHIRMEDETHWYTYKVGNTGRLERTEKFKKANVQ